MSLVDGAVLIEWLAQLGYPGLFILAFLSASIVPATSEIVLIALAESGFHPQALLLVATAGNYLGSLSTWWLGRFGRERWIMRWVRPSDKRLQQAEQLYARWGGPILFFSWIPIIGDALTFVAGVVHSNFWQFTIWVALGKYTRFALVLAAASVLF